MATAPYYADELVTLYYGDCREVTDWLAADVLVTDPPYGRGWKQGRTHKSNGWADDSHPGIAGDEDTSLRDWALTVWGNRRAIVFGDLMLAPPAPTKQVGVFRKSPLMGTKGTFAGFRRDAEAILLRRPVAGWSRWPEQRACQSGARQSGAGQLRSSARQARRRDGDADRRLPARDDSRSVRRRWLYSRRCQEPRPPRDRSRAGGAVLPSGPHSGCLRWSWRLHELGQPRISPLV